MKKLTTGTLGCDDFRVLPDTNRREHLDRVAAEAADHARDDYAYAICALGVCNHGGADTKCSCWSRA